MLFFFESVNDNRKFHEDCSVVGLSLLLVSWAEAPNNLTMKMPTRRMKLWKKAKRPGRSIHILSEQTTKDQRGITILTLENLAAKEKAEMQRTMKELDRPDRVQKEATEGVAGV